MNTHNNTMFEFINNMTIDIRKDEIAIFYSFENNEQQDSIIIFIIDTSHLSENPIIPILEPNQYFYEFIKYTKAFDIYGDNDNNDNEISFESYYTRGDGDLIFECFSMIPSDFGPLNCRIEFKVIEECYQRVSGRYQLNQFHTCITNFDIFLHGFYYYDEDWMATIKNDEDETVEIPKDISQLIETFSQVAFFHSPKNIGRIKF